jgi:TolA-binding protein
VEIVDNHSCVRVSEGVVSVARGNELERLTAGDESGCEVAPASAAKPTEPTTRVSVTDPRPSKIKRESAGTLTQENLLFKSALAAEQAGNLDQARLLAKRLLQRYPASPMAPEARRILARLREKQADPSTGQ